MPRLVYLYFVAFFYNNYLPGAVAGDVCALACPAACPLSRALAVPSTA